MTNYPMSSSSPAAAARSKTCGHSTMNASCVPWRIHLSLSSAESVTKQISPCATLPLTCRAPTPTAAAELATQITIIELTARNSSLQSLIANPAFNTLAEHQTHLSSLVAELGMPLLTAASNRSVSAWMNFRGVCIVVAASRSIASHTCQWDVQAAGCVEPTGGVGTRLCSGDIRKDDGAVVSRVAQNQAGEQISIRVSDGQIDADIINPKSKIQNRKS